MAILSGLRDRLGRPVDGASLAVFRMAFGALMVWEVVRYIGFDRVGRYWTEPEFHFFYPGFAWLTPPSHVALTVVWVVLGVLGAAIAVGAAFRVAAALFTVVFFAVFLLDPSTYLNHLYLVCLVSALLAVSPAHRLWSFDALRHPGWAQKQVPVAGLASLRGLVALVYLYAGLAKCNPDWLRAQPLLVWMEERADTPLIGSFLAWDPTAWLMSYAGLGLDLLAAPLLLWRRTRMGMVVVLGAFHLSNALVFDIGIFPWMMLAADLLFLEPGWPRRWVRRLRGGDVARLPVGPPIAISGALVAFLVAFFAVQALLPLRHLVYPGRPSWTEEGHWFAWHMKLRTKRGLVRMRVIDSESGETEIVYPSSFLSERQARKSRGNPELIRQIAVHLRRQAEAEGRQVTVRVDTRTRLNGRAPQALIDPHVDLSRVEWSWAPAPWIMPLEQPLPGWGW